MNNYLCTGAEVRSQSSARHILHAKLESQTRENFGVAGTYKNKRSIEKKSSHKRSQIKKIGATPGSKIR